MKKSLMIIIGIILIVVLLVILFFFNRDNLTTDNNDLNNEESNGSVTDSSRVEDDFKIDLVYHSDEGRDIHYSAYIPDNIEELICLLLYRVMKDYTFKELELI
ncbi:MAG TPA: hypothetical protein IAB59_03315 [Candidatus Onthousia faecipullorum]|uniref:Uncharacterized protein n=1 Tax=Candidatus Onthousia faecipullorum TaxID=2840887 RepID=A0A9D1GBI7_9FIRM|nr:hypothetical protein [Candidatus Onthousia faecipullorum]